MITIIPAMDIIEGKCVRLTRGDFSTRKIYNDDPLAVAREFESAGIKRLHMVDLDGARQQQIINYEVLDKVAGGTSLQIDFGGGVRSGKDIRIAFEHGARQVTAGSVAVKDPALVDAWLTSFGGEKIILGADVMDNKIAVSGWQEDSGIGLDDFIRDHLQRGLKYVICTDISRDGVLRGPATDLYSRLKKDYPELYLIASGGVSRIADISVLAEKKVDGVIIGKALYEGNIKLEELRPFLC
jgi:phosphoribosylformimino-5-aminoimidazole carboxamide ribotide isomerase